MLPEAIKEQIKLETELLRLYFVLFLADSSGTIALIGKKDFMENSINFALFIAGIVFAGVLLFLLYKAKIKIESLINHLNQ